MYVKDAASTQFTVKPEEAIRAVNFVIGQSLQIYHSEGFFCFVLHFRRNYELYNNIIKIYNVCFLSWSSPIIVHLNSESAKNY